MNGVTVIEGDVMAMLRTLESGSVDCVVTSPPYWQLRDYGVAGQWGCEATPEDWLCKMQALGRALHRVLKPDGTWWLNLGDCYSSAGSQVLGKHAYGNRGRIARCTPGVAPKQLLGLPWRAALALQGDGWWLRNDEVWCKGNAMPESTRDRATRAHEYIFQLTLRPQYYYDYKAVKEGVVDLKFDSSDLRRERPCKTDKQRGHSRRHAGFNARWDGMTLAEQSALGRNRRTWRVMGTCAIH